eukprot:TRINITY_DN21014_c0_g1_i1.p1 TRINITY_DN21014_c0_g1~~TRINITY_DN21014_c0_g1_i1.p1  ORF type:complete len:1478 (-),score=534.94 TRINITY_DN21014_c0_g1_i1:139-4572(-)
MSTAAEQIRQLRIRLSSPASSSSRVSHTAAIIPPDEHGINTLLGAILKVLSEESVRNPALFPAFSSPELTTEEQKLLEAAGLRDRGEPSVVFLERIEESLTNIRESSEKGVDDKVVTSSLNRLKHIRKILLSRQDESHSPATDDPFPHSRPQQYHSFAGNDDDGAHVDGKDDTVVVIDDGSPKKTEELKLRVEELESMENALSSELLVLQEERDKSKREKKELEERLKETEKREKVLRDEKGRMADRIRELEEREKSLESENEEMEERIREFDRRGEMEQKRLKDRLSQFEQGARSSQVQEERMGARIIELEEMEKRSLMRSKQMEQRIQELKEREESLIEENEFYVKSLKEQASRTEELVREKQIVEEECREIGAKLEQIESLRASDLKMFGTEMEDVQKKNEKLHHVVESMESTFAQMSEEIDSIQAEKTDRDERIWTLSEDLNTMLARFEQLHGLLVELEDHHKDMRSRFDGLARETEANLSMMKQYQKQQDDAIAHLLRVEDESTYHKMEEMDRSSRLMEALEEQQQKYLQTQEAHMQARERQIQTLSEIQQRIKSIEEEHRTVSTNYRELAVEVSRHRSVITGSDQTGRDRIRELEEFARRLELMTSDMGLLKEERATESMRSKEQYAKMIERYHRLEKEHQELLEIHGNSTIQFQEMHRKNAHMYRVFMLLSHLARDGVFDETFNVELFKGREDAVSHNIDQFVQEEIIQPLAQSQSESVEMKKRLEGLKSRIGQAQIENGNLLERLKIAENELQLTSSRLEETSKELAIALTREVEARELVMKETMRKDVHAAKTREIEERQKEVSQLRSELDRKSLDLQKQRREIDEMRTKHVLDIRGLEEENVALRDQLTTNERLQKESLRSRLSDIERGDQRCGDLLAEIESLRTSVLRQRDEIGKVQKSVADISDAVAVLRDGSGHDLKELESGAKRLATLNADLERRLEESFEKRRELQDTVDQMEELISSKDLETQDLSRSAKKWQTEHERTTAAFQDEIRTIDEAREAIARDLHASQQSLSALHSDVQSRGDALSSDIQSLADFVERMEDAVNKYKRQNDERYGVLLKAVKEMRLDVERTKSGVNAIGTELASIEDAAREFRVKTDQQLAGAELLNGELRMSLQSEMTRKEELEETLSKANLGLEGEYKEVVGQLESTRSKLVQTEKEMKKMDEEIRSMRLQLEQASDVMEQQQRENDNLLSRNATLERELEKTTEKLLSRKREKGSIRGRVEELEAVIADKNAQFTASIDRVEQSRRFLEGETVNLADELSAFKSTLGDMSKRISMFSAESRKDTEELMSFKREVDERFAQGDEYIKEHEASMEVIVRKNRQLTQDLAEMAEEKKKIVEERDHLIEVNKNLDHQLKKQAARDPKSLDTPDLLQRSRQLARNLSATSRKSAAPGSARLRDFLRRSAAPDGEEGGSTESGEESVGSETGATSGAGAGGSGGRSDIAGETSRMRADSRDTQERQM